MSRSFDSIAEDYDIHFSESTNGRNQRRRVWKYLDSAIKSPRSLKILEINCGTGLDAKHLADLGHSILATDESPKMLEITRRLSSLHGHEKKIKTALLDLKNPIDLSEIGPFDMIFSNFGGLNCLNPSELNSLNHFFYRNLNVGGHLIIVVMPRFTFLDVGYSIYRLNWKRLKQRITVDSPVNVKVGKKWINVFYYNVLDLKTSFNNFSFMGQRAIGLIPTYMSKLLENHKILSHLIKSLEKMVYSTGRFGDYSDHCLVHFRKIHTAGKL